MKSKLGKKMDRIRKTELEDANPIKTNDSVTLSKKEYLRPFIIYISFLAAWPSGKAGDCKSFLPSSNPGVAWSTQQMARNPASLI